MTSQPDRESTLIPIGEVVDHVRRTYPDVTHSSLRFLEREGFFVPTRTPGGHRLYTPGDVDRILQIKQLQAKRLSLAEIREHLDAARSFTNPAALASEVLNHLLNGAFDQARAMIFEADEAGVPLETLFDQVMTPALVEVGILWERGDMPVSEEREITQTSRDIIARLSLRHSPHPRTGPVLVAATVKGELHELGLRMVSGVLDCSGFVVHYLGADIATEFIVEAALRHRPDAMLLSARSGEHLNTLHEVVQAMGQAFAKGDAPRIIVGGGIVSLHEAELRSWGAIPLHTRSTATVAEAITLALA